MSKLFSKSEYLALAAVTSDFFICSSSAVKTESGQGLAALPDSGQSGGNSFLVTCAYPLRPVELLKPYVTGNGYVFDFLDGFNPFDFCSLDAPEFIASGSVRIGFYDSGVAFCQRLCRS